MPNVVVLAPVSLNLLEGHLGIQVSGLQLRQQGPFGAEFVSLGFHAPLK